MEKAQGEPFQFLGREFAGTASQGQLTIDMLQVGYQANQDWTLVCTRGQFDAAGVTTDALNNQEIQFRGRTLIITSADSNNTHFTLVAGKR